MLDVVIVVVPQLMNEKPRWEGGSVAKVNWDAVTNTKNNDAMSHALLPSVVNVLLG